VRLWLPHRPCIAWWEQFSSAEGGSLAHGGRGPVCLPASLVAASLGVCWQHQLLSYLKVLV
jgi:hypothetical protein